MEVDHERTAEGCNLWMIPFPVEVACYVVTKALGHVDL